ncbi:hypothetical protein HSBAA_26730 [Vreelandella sulfidaeris]|uniref:Uncharacterized protein n=1 Tax=Vreelandella sulfidaeris TaxID=115553 RepID=A0A455U754_9GAMM|nr:hypothetical protein HSBAA_26730 [Halomonas sulfidaeris]
MILRDPDVDVETGRPDVSVELQEPRVNVSQGSLMSTSSAPNRTWPYNRQNRVLWLMRKARPKYQYRMKGKLRYK